MGECWWRTCRSSWFGHQSRFDRGRLVVGVGAGMAGFSLSLTLSDTSVLLSSVAAGRFVAGVDGPSSPV
jgi:hypothetical protein